MVRLGRYLHSRARHHPPCRLRRPRIGGERLVHPDGHRSRRIDQLDDATGDDAMMRRVRTEQGSALVAAVIAIAMMLMVGLATYSLVDAQQGQATRAHIGESSFRLANAALNQQMFQLGSAWPSTTATGYPTSCTSTAPGGATCPNAAALSSSFTGPEYASGT